MRVRRAVTSEYSAATKKRVQQDEDADGDEFEEDVTVAPRSPGRGY